MAGSGTSLWPNLLAGQRARASEVEFKFDWLEANHLPMLSGSTTDLTYDLGASNARWRAGWFGSVNPTTTANALVLGTTTAVTTAANNSDVSMELAGPKALLINRVTTTQKNNLAGINGMLVYDSTLNLFQKYENGAWANMGGSTIGFVFPVFASVTSAATTTVLSVSAPGRLLRLSGIGNAASAYSGELNIDGIKYGDHINNTSTVSYLGLANTITAATSGVFAFTSTADYHHLLELYFKNTLIVYHSNNGSGAPAQTGIWYERT